MQSKCSTNIGNIYIYIYIYSQSYFVTLLVNIVLMNGKYYVDVMKHQSFQPYDFNNENVHMVIHNQKKMYSKNYFCYTLSILKRSIAPKELKFTHKKHSLFWLVGCFFINSFNLFFIFLYFWSIIKNILYPLFFSLLLFHYFWNIILHLPRTFLLY